MGSYSLSQNSSSTANQNLPISQQDVSNPLNLVNSSNARLNSSDITQSGSFSNSTNTLDGGAIGAAFNFGNQALGFGTQAISQLASLTTSLNAQSSKNNTDAVNAVLTSASGQAAAVATDWFQNPKILVAAVALAVAFMYAKKG